MTQEQKDLLLKDLCSRLNTNLVCSIYRVDDQGVGYRDEILTGYCKGDIWYEFYFGDDCGICIDNVSKIKPYLFPLESMTEEQDKEFALLQTSPGQEGFLYAWNCANMMKWLIENNFDYNGLIPNGLANDATGLNIY